mmetsp:Transcript_581/g.1817  ORF Transcript_581/g.1817 Transcript_581/m.1817 type:complete len:216 (+) Transcript_581:337-984(+)
MSGSQVSLSLVALTSPPGLSLPTRPTTSPEASVFTSSMKQLPQLMKVTSSPFATALASSWSMRMRLVLVRAFFPVAGFFLCLSTISTSGSAGPFSRSTGTLLSATTAVCLPQTGSMSFLFSVQSLSHSWLVVFLEAPCCKMKSLRAGTVRPLLSRPWTVGNLGSVQLLTLPVSTNHCSFLLLITVFTMFSLENSQMFTLGKLGSTSCCSFRIHLN